MKASLRKALGNRWLIRGLILVAAVAFLLQLMPAERTNPPVVSDLTASEEVYELVRRACYDCHSHETSWPWYSRIQPFGWWVSDHVREGRKDLNFSDWPVLDFDAEDLLLEDIHGAIVDQEMPLKGYALLHPQARLSEAERRVLLEWSQRR